MSSKNQTDNLSCFDRNITVTTDRTLPRLRCDEGLPLGNGLLGALVWSENGHICISLNRSDLWDERRPKADSDVLYNWQDMCRLVAEKNYDKLTELFRKAPDEPFPTLLPGGRVELSALSIAGSRFSLDEKAACANITASDWKLQIFVPAEEAAVCRWQLQGKKPNCRLRMKLFEADGEKLAEKLGYGTPQIQRHHNRQIMALGSPDKNFAFALGCDFQTTGTQTSEGVIVIAKSCTVEAAQQSAAAMLDAALAETYSHSFRRHKKYWRQIHQHCDIKFADKTLTELWHQARYFFNSNARKNCPPISLVGVWAIDDGTFPICRGDYHNNLNTQFTYLSYLAANDLTGGREFLDFMASLSDCHRRLAQDFYRIDDGIVIPGAMTLAGGIVPGIVNYTYHPDNGLWIAWMFYRHWRYTMDRDFLEKTAYPYMSQTVRGAVRLANLDSSDKYVYPWQAFPELGDEQPESYFYEMTSYMNSNLYAVLTALIDAAEILDLPHDKQYWLECLSHCRQPEEFAANFDYYLHHKHVLGIQPGVPLNISHRHHSHLMALYPYDLLDLQDEKIRELAVESIEQLDFLGTGLWVGFSLIWAAIMALRTGNARKGFYWFNIYKDCFMGINGFYYNGDFKDTGCSAYKYRPFTLETVFAGQEFLQETVLSESRGVLTLFPAAEILNSAEFKKLRAPGAFIISGSLKNRQVAAAEIISEAGEMLRIANPGGCWQIIDLADNRIVLKSSDEILTTTTVKNGRYRLERVF